MGPNNNLASNIDLSETIQKVAQCHSTSDPVAVLQEVAIVNDKLNNMNGFFPLSTDDYKALSLYEFNNGILLTEAVPDKYRTLAIQMMRQLQQEFNCLTSYEMSLTELAALSYVRILDSQNQLSDVYMREKVEGHRHDSCVKRSDDFYKCSNISTACKRTDYLLKLASILTKDLDRAHRQYLSAIQVLSSLHKPNLQVNIKTNTTVVGNQQIVNTGNL